MSATSDSLETSSRFPADQGPVGTSSPVAARSNRRGRPAGKQRAAGPSPTQRAAAVDAELVRVTYGNAARSVWANFVALAAFAGLAYGDVSATLVVGWCGVTSAVLVGRYLLVRNRQGQPAYPQAARKLLREYAIGTSLTGAVFGLGFLAFATEVSAHERALMLVGIAGMCAGAAVSMSVAGAAFYGYVAAAVMPPLGLTATVAWQEGGVTPVAELLVLTAITAVALTIHRTANTFVRHCIHLQIENDQLVGDLRQHSASLSRDRDAFRLAALTDALTGVANRRSFDESLTRMWRDCAADGEKLGCLLIDVDLFKPYNDRYGHESGDRCLARIAAAMAEVARRSGDYLARYGGEEFVVLLPNATPAGTLYLGELIREAVEALQVEHAGSPHRVVTVSVGACAMRAEAGNDPQDVVNRADQALYSGKERGRNRVQLLHSGGTISADSGPAFPAEPYA